MGKSRHRKDHKKKANARKVKMKSENNRMEKAKKNFIMDLINREKEKGLYDNNAIVPSVDGPIIEGPSI